MNRTCYKCNETKEESLFQFNKGTYVNLCKDCANRISKERHHRVKKSILRSEFINCIIKENNKEYKTTELTDKDVIELKESGYYFIFK